METIDIELNQVRISSLNARKDLEAGTEDADFDDFVNSIRDEGLLQPIIVRTVLDGGYEIIAGQRRFLAYRELGLPTIPALVRDDLDDIDATAVSLIENVQRADLNAMDKARVYQALHEKYGSVSLVAKKVGVTPQTVRRYLPLLNLDMAIQTEVSTRGGIASVETLSVLGENFPADDQLEVLERTRVLNPTSQKEVIKNSKGNLDLIPELVNQAMEKNSIPVCREGLCGLMPEEEKTRIRARLGI